MFENSHISRILSRLLKIKLRQLLFEQHQLYVNIGYLNIYFFIVNSLHITSFFHWKTCMNEYALMLYIWNECLSQNPVTTDDHGTPCCLKKVSTLPLNQNIKYLYLCFSSTILSQFPAALLGGCLASPKKIRVCFSLQHCTSVE